MFLEEKYILKKAFADILPESVATRPKQPYRAPDAASFFKEEPEWLSDLLSERYVRKAGIFQAKFVEKLIEKARRYRGQGMSNTDNMRICAVISTMLLYEQFIEHSPGDKAKAIQLHTPLKVIDKTKNF
jgi:asparagine synthase (glutamine-hydrolysing)